MKLVIANDHAAVDLKFAILEHLKERGIEVVNIGTDTKERYQYRSRVIARPRWSQAERRTAAC